MSSAYPAGLRAWTSELNVRLIVEFNQNWIIYVKKILSQRVKFHNLIVECRALKLSAHNQYFNVLIKYECELDPNVIWPDLDALI